MFLLSDWCRASARCDPPASVRPASKRVEAPTYLSAIGARIVPKFSHPVAMKCDKERNYGAVAGEVVSLATIQSWFGSVRTSSSRSFHSALKPP